jgi:hypothetical protein
MRLKELAQPTRLSHREDLIEGGKRMRVEVIENQDNLTATLFVLQTPRVGPVGEWVESGGEKRCVPIHHRTAMASPESSRLRLAALLVYL